MEWAQTGVRFCGDCELRSIHNFSPLPAFVCTPPPIFFASADKKLDIKVTDFLVGLAVQGLAEGSPDAAFVAGKVEELLEFITGHVSTNPLVWSAYVVCAARGGCFGSVVPRC